MEPKVNGSGSAKRYLVFIVILFALLVLAIFNIVGGGLEHVVYYLSRSYDAVLIAAAIIFLEESLKSVRFVIAARSRGLRLSPLRAWEAHFSSLFIGMLTPAFSGAIPTATAIIGSATGAPPPEALSVALSATFIDSVVPAAVSLYFAWSLMPRSVVVLLISITIIVIWAMVISRRLTTWFLSEVSRRLNSNAARLIEGEIENMRDSLSHIIASRRSMIPMLLVSAASYIIEAFSIYVLTLGGLHGFLIDLEALMMSYVGGNVPTPGGEGGVEYSLALVLKGVDAVLWRTAYIIVAMVPIVLLGKIVSEYVDYGSLVYSHYRAMLRGRGG